MKDGTKILKTELKQNDTAVNFGKPKPSQKPQLFCETEPKTEQK